MSEASIFASIIIKQVEAALSESPTADDCLLLFKIFDPALTYDSINSEAKRDKLFRQVKLRIHPDKHSGNIQADATRVFKKLEAFTTSLKSVNFPVNLVSPDRKRAKIYPPSRFPAHFHVEASWPGLKNISFTPLKTSRSVCLNMRGQIWHNSSTSRNIGVFHHCNPQSMGSFVSIKVPAGMAASEAIKEELTTYGPVISRSYTLPKGVPNTTSDHPIIVGWKFDEVQGEVWIVRFPISSTKDLHVAFDTLCIEDNVIIPPKNASHFKWQHGVYMNVPNEDEWIKLRAGATHQLWLTPQGFVSFLLSLGVKKASELFRTGRQAFFEVYEAPNFAVSRKAYFSDFETNDESNVIVYITFD